MKERKTFLFKFRSKRIILIKIIINNNKCNKCIKKDYKAVLKIFFAPCPPKKMKKMRNNNNNKYNYKSKKIH